MDKQPELSVPEHKESKLNQKVIDEFRHFIDHVNFLHLEYFKEEIEKVSKIKGLKEDSRIKELVKKKILYFLNDFPDEYSISRFINLKGLDLLSAEELQQDEEIRQAVKEAIMSNIKNHSHSFSKLLNLKIIPLEELQQDEEMRQAVREEMIYHIKGYISSFYPLLYLEIISLEELQQDEEVKQIVKERMMSSIKNLNWEFFQLVDLKIIPLEELQQDEEIRQAVREEILYNIKNPSRGYFFKLLDLKIITPEELQQDKEMRQAVRERILYNIKNSQMDSFFKLLDLRIIPIEELQQDEEVKRTLKEAMVYSIKNLKIESFSKLSDSKIIPLEELQRDEEMRQNIKETMIDSIINLNREYFSKLLDLKIITLEELKQDEEVKQIVKETMIDSIKNGFSSYPSKLLYLEIISLEELQQDEEVKQIVKERMMYSIKNLEIEYFSELLNLKIITLEELQQDKEMRQSVREGILYNIKNSSMGYFSKLLDLKIITPEELQQDEEIRQAVRERILYNIKNSQMDSFFKLLDLRIIPIEELQQDEEMRQNIKETMIDNIENGFSSDFYKLLADLKIISLEDIDYYRDIESVFALFNNIKNLNIKQYKNKIIEYYTYLSKKKQVIKSDILEDVNLLLKYLYLEDEDEDEDNDHIQDNDQIDQSKNIENQVEEKKNSIYQNFLKEYIDFIKNPKTNFKLDVFIFSEILFEEDSDLGNYSQTGALISFINRIQKYNMDKDMNKITLQSIKNICLFIEKNIRDRDIKTIFYKSASNLIEISPTILAHFEETIIENKWKQEELEYYIRYIIPLYEMQLFMSGFRKDKYGISDNKQHENPIDLYELYEDLYSHYDRGDSHHAFGNYYDYGDSYKKHNKDQYNDDDNDDDNDDNNNHYQYNNHDQDNDDDQDNDEYINMEYDAGDIYMVKHSIQEDFYRIKKGGLEGMKSLIEEKHKIFEDFCFSKLGILKIPDDFSREHLKYIRNFTTYIFNISEPNGQNIDLISLYLALHLNNEWVNFRSGREIDLSKYLDANKLENIQDLLSDRKIAVSEMGDFFGLSETEEISFQKTLQGNTEYSMFSNTQTIDSMLVNVRANMDVFLDPDSYRDHFYKNNHKLLLEKCQKINKLLATLFSKLKNKEDIFITIDQIEDEDIKIFLKSLNLNNIEDVRRIQELVYPFSSISNVWNRFTDSINEKINILNNTLDSNQEIRHILNKYNISINDIGHSIFKDVEFLDKILIDPQHRLDKNEKGKLVSFIKEIKDLIINLSTEYKSIKDSISKIQTSKINDDLFSSRIEVLKKDIFNPDNKSNVITTMTTDMNLVIENIRGCIGCKSKEWRNHTNLTFGSGDKFFIINRSGRTKSISDELVYFLANKNENNETTGFSFVMDTIYGNKSVDILINNILAISKKISELQRVKDIKIPILIPNRSINSVGVDIDLLIEQLKKQGFKDIKQVEEKVYLPETSLGEHHWEFSYDYRDDAIITPGLLIYP